MVISASFGLDLISFDVEKAFLNGVALARELHGWPPNDVSVINPPRRWKLKKHIFGLTEAPRLCICSSVARVRLERGEGRTCDLHFEGYEEPVARPVGVAS